MDMRRDPVAAAARFLLEGRRIANKAGSVTTVGTISALDGIVTAVAPLCELSFDQRNLDDTTLQRMLADAKQVSQQVAAEENVTVEWSVQWRIPARPFDAELIELAEAAIQQTVGVVHRMPSGALHDAAEMASAGIPTVMIFVQSLRGLSHTKEEDTRVEDLEASVRALDRLAEKTIGWISAGQH
jgi:N-carbamoyl-L-amino-acid hydrolase